MLEFPYKTMGKLFFKDSKGAGYECSGQYIAPNLVLTAGHCVYSVEQRSWNKGFLFVQQYKGVDGGSSYSGVTRRVNSAIVNKKWYVDGEPNWAYDAAILAMKDDSIDGTHMGYDWPERYSKWTAAGYPSNYQQGQTLMKFLGSKGGISDNIVEMPDDPMGPGCSGGAWIAPKGDGHYYAAGVNSFSVSGRTSMFSPRLTPQLMDSILTKAKK